MKSDAFINNNEDNPFSGESVNNFFLQPENISSHHSGELSRRLNDYDYNILKEEAYKDVKDEVFKLEYKMAKIENEIKQLDARIQASKDIHDFNKVELLCTARKRLQEELQDLLDIYNDTSLSAKITGGLTNSIKNKFNFIRRGLYAFVERVISRLPAPFSSALELKKSLSKLEIINKNVNELVKLNTPYGESYDKYERLSKYIVRANSIQAEISRSLK